MPIEQAIFVAMEVCKGLAHAHEKKAPDGTKLEVVHRDISPPNILISRDGEVKITDFGLAKAVIQIEHTDPGIVKGKFGYLSPEAALGETVDLRTDIFAVGILLWEMLAGKRLFLGETDIKTLEQVRAANIPKPRPDIPKGLEEIILKTLARDRDNRFQSAQEMGSALARFLFSYGKPVTSYDLAAMVKTALYQMPATETAKDIGVIDILIQNEMEKFISVEEMEDLNELNLVGAKPLTVDDLAMRSSSDLPSYGFEDPRTWAGDALDEEAEQSPSEPASKSKADTPVNAKTAVKKAGEDEPNSKVAWIVIIVLLTLVVIGLILLIGVFFFNKG
jgi:serine/threonine-protein kinase